MCKYVHARTLARRQASSMRAAIGARESRFAALGRGSAVGGRVRGQSRRETAKPGAAGRALEPTDVSLPPMARRTRIRFGPAPGMQTSWLAAATRLGQARALGQGVPVGSCQRCGSMFVRHGAQTHCSAPVLGGRPSRATPAVGPGALLPVLRVAVRGPGQCPLLLGALPAPGVPGSAPSHRASIEPELPQAGREAAIAGRVPTDPLARREAEPASESPSAASDWSATGGK